MTQDLVSIFDDFFSKNNRFVGFRDLFDMPELKMDQKMIAFPPYNIYKKKVVLDNESDKTAETSDRTIIELALAGYSKNDVNASFNEKTHFLTIETKPDYGVIDDKTITYHYKGIGKRAFKLSWKLNPNLELDRCEWKDGLCRVIFRDKTEELEDCITTLNFE